MAISRIGGASNSAANGGAINVTLPGSMATDDLIIAAWGMPGGADEDMAPSTAGYTEVADLFSNDTEDINLWCGYKFHNGSDTQFSVPALGSTAEGNTAAVQVFRGVKLVADGGPFDVAAVTATGINSGQPDPPSIDHSGAAGIWVVIVGGAGHTLGLTTFNAPANYTTNFVTVAANDTNDSTIGIGYRSNPADPENPDVMTLVGTTTSFAWAAVTMALAEAAGAAPQDPIFHHAFRSIYP